MMRAISSRTHGFLDYGSVILLFALPRILHWSEQVTMLLTLMAGATLVYSLLTRYELGAFRMIPMRGHLALDIASGILLLGAALLMGSEPDGVRWALAALGVMEIGAGAMTDPVTSLHGEAETSRTRARGL